jgi:arsenate reductase-like glutaredoxin family protein
MAAGITLWGRNKHEESMQAIAFLRKHGFRADRLLDLDRQPPTIEEVARIKVGLSGTLAPLASTGIEPPNAAWFHEYPLRFKAPILLTPKGALVGFREQAWHRFFELGKIHDAA